MFTALSVLREEILPWQSEFEKVGSQLQIRPRPLAQYLLLSSLGALHDVALLAEAMSVQHRL